MKHLLSWGLGIFILMALFIGLVWVTRATQRVTANLTVRTIEPGINCAVLLDQTGGNALSCYPSPNAVKPQ